ncbi:MAG: hypothetical protein H0X31_00255 [Nostocaceae cyanobacterium]|nr:hypothetical protein [Nostocaceae cyanobacterium]
MTSFLCEQVIDFDAVGAYEAGDIELLIEQIQTTLNEAKNRKVVVLLRNAHYLTTRAFVVLYNYVRDSLSKNTVFVLVSTDESRIFPPLLDFVQNESSTLGVA